MPAQAIVRAACSRHEARVGIVVLKSWCLVRLSNGGLGPPDEIVSLPACTRSSICRGAALASRLTRWLSVEISDAAAKHFFSLCSTEHPFQIQNLYIFHATQRTGLADEPCFPQLWRSTFCNSEDLDAPCDESSFFAVTQQQWRACVRRMLCCKLACILPLSSLDPRLASGAFAVVKDEGSRERSIGRAHLPYCPRLRRMMFRKSEMVQTTLRSWLEHLDGETWDLVDSDDIESWVSQDLLETCASFEPVSELDYCQMGMIAIVMGDVNAVYTLECAHRRQLLGARALNERSLLIRRLTFPAHKDDWR